MRSANTVRMLADDTPKPKPTQGLPAGRAEQILYSKDVAASKSWVGQYDYDEGWAIIDGTVVIYNMSNPPDWLARLLARRDES